MKKTLLSLVALLGIATTSLAEVTFTCTAGKNFGSNEGIDKMFDGNVNTKYCQNTGDDCYALLTASEPIYSWGYELTTANDNEQYGRLVTGWALYGTNDETVAADASADGWVALSILSSNSYIQKKNYYTQRFFCDKTTIGTAYKYFKVCLTAGGFVQVSEFKILGETQPIVTYEWEESTSDNSKKAVDWLVGQKWEGSNLAGNTLTMKTSDGQPHTLKSYSFTTHDDGSWNDRAPKTWIIEGSNDKSTWATIDEVTDDPISNVNYTTFSFSPANVDAAYTYIRLTLKSMKSTGWTQIGEFFPQTGCATHTWVAGKTQGPTCVDAGGTYYSCSVCGATKFVLDIPASGVHTYSDGYCTVCNRPDPSWMTAVDGYYQPTTVDQFNWLAAMISYKETVNIKLTQDVDLTGFAGFGNGDNVEPFKGEFDGQGHWLKNLKIDVTLKNTGLFGKTEGANIHDLGFDNAYVKTGWGYANAGGLVGNAKNTTINRVAVVKGSYVEGYDHVGAIVGNTEGTTTVSNCLSDADILSGAYQAGGLIGTSNGLTLENSLFTGTVKNNNYNASGLVALIDGSGSPTVIKNNISAASLLWVGQSDGLYSIVNTGGRSATYTNNHIAASQQYQAGTSDAYTKTWTNADDSNGLTTADKDMKLKNFYTETMGWDMTNDWKFVGAGQYPVLAWMDAATAQTVTVPADGYATMVAEAELTIPAGVEAFAVKTYDKAALLPIEGAIPAGQAVVIRAAKGTYDFAYATEYANDVTVNDLVAATADVEATGTQYILANGTEGIGFYKATTGTTIAAGKGYLVIDGADVKAFVLEDTTTGINSMSADATANSVIYNLAGQRISKAQKGINIVNGKKYLK